MIPTPDGRSFIVIGENIHASRTIKRTGKLITLDRAGRPSIRFTGSDGDERLLEIPDAVQTGSEFVGGRVKHVKSAILAGLGGNQADVAAAREYVGALARRQEAAGADYLDLNVDEAAVDAATRIAAIRWLVEAVEDVASVPVAIDSSGADVIAAGLIASRRPAGPPLINSASTERPEVLDLAARSDCPVILSASGRTTPAGPDARVANAHLIIEAARSVGLSLDKIHVDALVLPIAVEPEAASSFLEAVRRLRATFGPDVHLTGGLSNVSFGLPARRLLNDVFINLAVEAGVDSGVIDPVVNDPARVFGQDRTGAAYGLAEDVLLGRDPYGAEFLAAYRGGRLIEAGAPAAGG
jgi:5-methyltetrahydrofolate--homocysteine methyltransferase